MGKQNRVTPYGDIVRSTLRGEWMGNRGCLHEGDEIVRPWNGKRWIICRTSFKGRRVAQWAPGRYTVLFFHDEAVALAAGHRPCAECRRSDYERFRDAWERAHGVRPKADEIDAVLHAARASDPRTHLAPWPDVPDGVFVDLEDEATLVIGDQLARWDPNDGYTTRTPRPPDGLARVLTPAPTVAVLRHGYRAALALAC